MEEESGGVAIVLPDEVWAHIFQWVKWSGWPTLTQWCFPFERITSYLRDLAVLVRASSVCRAWRVLVWASIEECPSLLPYVKVSSPFNPTLLNVDWRLNINRQNRQSANACLEFLRVRTTRLKKLSLVLSDALLSDRLLAQVPLTVRWLRIACLKIRTEQLNYLPKTLPLHTLELVGIP